MISCKCEFALWILHNSNWDLKEEMTCQKSKFASFSFSCLGVHTNPLPETVSLSPAQIGVSNQIFLTAC